MHSYQVTAFGQPLVKTTRDTPVPKGREVLVRIGACGVCHSDVHLHDGYFDLGGGKKVDMTRGVQPPRTLGHEIAGEIVALGPEITAADKLSLGARRVVYPWIGCGTCTVCQRGQEQDCSAPRAHGVNTDGGYADHVLVPDAKYLFEYGTLSEEQACTYACSGLTAFGALKKAKGLVGPGPGNDLLIIGAGGVGISGIRMAKPVLGVAPIVADIDPSKFEAARQAGAREVIDSRSPDTLRNLLKSTGGGAAVAIDYVGAAASFEFGMNALRRGGKLIVVGLFGGATTFSPATIVLKGLTITASYVGSREEMAEMMALASSGTLPAMPVNVEQLANVNDVLARLKQGKIVGRTVVKP
jgi:D-arabinose 1-dehydrogenase-like Zn-dependent alcohol dehydrogenase